MPSTMLSTVYLRCALAVLLLSVAPGALQAEEGTGKIAVAYYREAPGNTIEDLKNVPAFPTQPTEQLYLDKFETPEDQPTNFAALIRGYVHPPETAEYTFSIAADDKGALYLSTDEDPAKKVKIAEAKDWCLPKVYKNDERPDQVSKPIKLEAGKKYYIEAIHKDGGGDNNCSVAWAWNGSKLEKPIEGKFLSPAAEMTVPPPKVTFKQPLPDKPGVHRIKVDVEYRAKKFEVPVLLTLPDGFVPKAPSAKNFPVLVYMHEGDEAPPADGYRIQGTDKEMAKNAELKKKYPYIGISPQFPKEGNWTVKTVITVVDAAIGALVEQLPSEARKVYLTGRDAGGTAVWALAVESPKRYAAIVPICAYWGNTEPAVIEKLRTIPVYIIAGAKNGLASDSAKKMSEALKDKSKLEGVEYGMDETGKEPKYGSEIADKMYADDYIWSWMFAKALPGPKVAKTKPKAVTPDPTAAYAGPHSYYLSVGLMGIAALMLVVGFYFAMQSKQLVKVSTRSEE